MPHIHDQYDFSVTAFIVYGDRVLLVEHPRYQKWLPIGGHIELNEDPEEALYREIAEETGLEVEVLASKPDIESSGTKFILTPSYVDVHEANLPHKHISFIYFGRAKNDSMILSGEHLNYKWFSLDDAADPAYNLSPSIKFYIESALKAAKA
ncbi:MAG TPA: NUDIX domain-containing protein [Candidatus Saccharimonadales bacterium]|nr:NUDIX domain-containing protein [Candidatus Saccharimonadales bacterium]